MTRQVWADNVALEYTYESTTSRLRQRKDPKLQIASYEYFLDDQLKQTTYSGALVPTANVSFTYDPVYGRSATMTDGTGTTTYGYHPVTTPPALGAGRLATVDGPLANDTISYTYDALGNTASRGLVGFTSTFAYDALGRMGAQGTPLGSFLYTFDGRTARPLTLTLPNGQATQYTYFPNVGDHRLQEIKHLALGGAVLSKFNYTYDNDGKIKTWMQQLAPDPVTVYDLGYDAANQLTAATLRSTDPTPVTLKRYGYAYDPAGNRISEQIDDAVTSWTPNNRNQLTSRQAGGALLFRGTVNEAAAMSVQGRPAQVTTDNRFEGTTQVPSGISTVTIVAQDYAQPPNVRTNTYQLNVSGTGTTTFTYDLNGNLTGDETKTYEWSAENQLVRVLQGVTELARFVYDGQGRRVQKFAGGVTRTYVYDDQDIVEERVSTGQTIRHVQGTGIDQHLASQDGPNVSYYLSDHLGSIVQATNAAGTVTQVRRYDPWGNLLAGSNSSGWAFTGREWEPETGLYYYRARYYDPATARFITSDPLGLAGGMNTYAYAHANPVLLTDPLGLVASPSPSPPTNCAQICAQAYANPRDNFGSGGVMCAGKLKCPCVFDTLIKNEATGQVILSVKKGECPEFDEIKMKHEEAHCANTFCDGSKEPKRGGPPPGRLTTGEECRHRREDVRRLTAPPPGTSPDCVKKMGMAAFLQGAWVNQHCGGF